MKKIKINGELIFRSLKKIMLIMRISIFFLIVGILQLSAKDGYSQKAKLSLAFNDVEIIKVLDNIEAESEFYFLYNEKLFDTSRKVNITANDQPIDVILDNLFAGTNVKYTIIDRKIILAPDYLINDTDANMSIQQQVVAGKVTDSQTGEPIPGVNVVVKGTTIGVTTDVNGRYSINLPDRNGILVFSFIGYISQEIPISGRETLDIELKLEVTGLEEVVVIGYGTQKKVNLTGAVSSVGSKDIEKLSVTQTSQLLAGITSGLTVLQSTSQPGKDNVDIIVRGLGTFSSAGNRPLVLVDGLASSLDDVNINDIASISVLKDAASASIYGARGANGVILVETKKGREGEFRIAYQGNIGIQRPYEIPNLVDSWVYAEMYNEALRNAGGSPQYSAEEIEKFKSGVDPDNYPNTPHYKNLISSGSGLQTDHYLSFTGGTSKSSFVFSLGYLDQTGIVAETNYKRFNILLNANSRIKENLSLNVKMSGKRGVSNEPTAVDKNPSLGVDGLINYAIKIPNTYAGKMSNGYYGNQTGFTIEGWMDSESFISNSDLTGTASISLDWELIKNLTFTLKAGYENSIGKYKLFRPVLVVDQFITQGPSELTVRNSANSLLTLQGYINYYLNLKNHNLHFLAGYSQEENKYEWIQAFRDNFPSNTLYEINAGAASNQQCGGSASEWALQSFFGRVSYNFNERYLFEANARYDGSSRFPPQHKYGLFPSASIGWRLSEENFFKVSWINELKIRGSYGELGNQNIGNYPYQQLITLGLNAPFGVPEKLLSGAAATTVPNLDITWETTRVADIGFDLSVFKNKLSLSIDYFNKLTSGILYNITASRVLGLTPSVQNAGKVSNNGVDLIVQHRNTIGDFSYNVAANFSYVKNEVVELANVTRDINSGLFVGYPLESIYGYVADGLFVDQADIDNSPIQPRTAKPGDIKFVDISGPNGVPDGKVDADYDRKIIGNTFPKYSFGSSINLQYKGFDFSVQCQGIAGLQQLIGGYEGNAFYHGSNIQQWMVDERWTEANPNPHAKYPRLLVLGGGEQQFWNSTYILLDASYLRINNMQLGYTIPKNLLYKIGISNVRLYANIKNLLTIDKFREGWDPEVRTGYPMVRYSSFGININF